uniref:Putative secreted protein n=1 Tax=Amblyomma americanum TaxID=6943 RepID=A0A0C9S3M6_AMBAM
MNNREYMHNAVVILPLIILGSFLMSARAARGIPQLATGPQKWVLHRYSLNSLLPSCLMNWLAYRDIFFFNVAQYQVGEVSIGTTKSRYGLVGLHDEQSVNLFSSFKS